MPKGLSVDRKFEEPGPGLEGRDTRHEKDDQDGRERWSPECRRGDWGRGPGPDDNVPGLDCGSVSPVSRHCGPETRSRRPSSDPPPIHPRPSGIPTRGTRSETPVSVPTFGDDIESPFCPETPYSRFVPRFVPEEDPRGLIRD